MLRTTQQITSLSGQDAFGEASQGSEDCEMCEEIQGQEWGDKVQPQGSLQLRKYSLSQLRIICTFIL